MISLSSFLVGFCTEPSRWCFLMILLGCVQYFSTFLLQSCTYGILACSGSQVSISKSLWQSSLQNALQGAVEDDLQLVGLCEVGMPCFGSRQQYGIDYAVEDIQFVSVGENGWSLCHFYCSFRVLKLYPAFPSPALASLSCSPSTLFNILNTAKMCKLVHFFQFFSYQGDLLFLLVAYLHKLCFVHINI